MENKRKHLDYIQAAITRMGQHSFLIKGWAVTLVSAVFVFASSGAEATRCLLIPYVVIVMFWGLDGFFLATEQRFRALYNVVRVREEGEIDFVMNPMPYASQYPTWKAALSKTLLTFYVPLVILTVGIRFLIE